MRRGPHEVTSMAVGWVVAVGRVAATVGTGIGSIIVTSLRRCCDYRRTEQCEDARDDQCQSAAGRRASGNSTVHYKLQHARADPATVVTKKFRPKCDRLHTRPSRQERLRFLRMRNPTWESCDEHAVTADLSESNHEDFREIPGTPAQPTCVAAIGVNPLLNFPDMRRMRCSDFSWPSLNERFSSANFKQPSPEAIRPNCYKDQHNNSRDCAMTRRSTCRCAKSVAKQQRREMWRKPVGGRQRDFRR